MHARTAAIAGLSIALLLPLLAACGDPPQKFTRAEVEGERGGAAPARGALPPDHPPLGPNHPPIGGQGATGGAAIAGVVEIGGELANYHGGTIYVIAWKGEQVALVRKYGHADFEHLQSGESRLRFALDQQHVMAGGGLSGLELEVRYDTDGFTDTKDDILATVRVPVDVGDLEVLVRLDDEHRTSTPLPGG